MVGGRTAGRLLGLAARWWPSERRAELLAEWSAEAHTLLHAGRPWAALRFAGSLALTPPRVRPGSPASAARAGWAGLRLVVVLPLVALVVGIAGACSPLLALPGAVLMALLGRRYAPRRLPPAALVPLAAIPGCALYAVLYLNLKSPPYGLRHAVSALLFGAGLMLTLAAVAPLARARRRWPAWPLGVAGALAAADAAVAVPYLTDFAGYGNPAMWMVVAMFGDAVGPRLGHMQAFTIQDVVEVDPGVFLAVAGLALGVVITAARARRPAAGPAADLTAT